MLSTEFANCVGQAIQHSVTMSGICALTSMDDPKTAGVANFVFETTTCALVPVLRSEAVRDNLPLALVVGLAVPLVAGQLVAQRYNPNFDLVGMLIKCAGVRALTKAVASTVLGIRNIVLY